MSDTRPPARAARRPPVLEAYALVVALLVWLGAPPPPALCVLGDLRTWLAGQVPASLVRADLDAAPFALGIGKAAVGDWQNLGDAVVVAGRLYLLSTAAGTGEYRRLVQAGRFRTSSFALLAPGTRLPARARPPESSVAQLLAGLDAEFPRGALFAGYLQFRQLHLYAVSRPAIHGLPVAAGVTDYYTEPVRTAVDAWAYVVGINARQPLPAPQRDDPLYQRLLAPAERPELHIVIALRIAAPPADTAAAPDPQTVLDLGQVARHSVIAGGELEVLPFSRVADCDPAALAANGAAVR